MAISRSACAAAVATLGLAGCGGGVDVAQIPLSKDFAECNDFSSNDDVSTVDCPDGELRILVSQPDQSPIHLVPFRFDPSEDGLAVEADSRLVSGNGAYGIGCAVSEAGEPGRGYLFVLLHGDSDFEGAAAITRLDWTEAEGQTWQGIRAKRKAVRAVQEVHHVGGMCTNAADGSARLTMTVDGRVVVRARDPKALGPLTAAIPVVFAGAPGTDARFDDLHVDVTER